MAGAIERTHRITTRSPWVPDKHFVLSGMTNWGAAFSKRRLQGTKPYCRL